MRIKFDRLLFLVGLGLLMIGAAAGALVIVVSTISLLLNLFG